MTKNLIDQSDQSQPGKGTDDSVNQSKRDATSRDRREKWKNVCERVANDWLIGFTIVT